MMTVHTVSDSIGFAFFVIRKVSTRIDVILRSASVTKPLVLFLDLTVQSIQSEIILYTFDCNCNVNHLQNVLLN